MTIQTKTTGSQIQEAIGSLLEPGRILPRDNADVVRLFDEVDLLAKANPDEARRSRAMLLHLVGDLDGALQLIQQCETYEPSTELAVLVNYSRCIRAQELYARYGTPREGLFTRLARFGFACGAFKTMAAFSREARRMNLTNLESVPTERLFEIERLMTEFGIEDSQTAQLLEVAGSVLEANRLLFLGNGPDVDVFDIPDELRAVHLTYHLATTAESAVAISLQFVERLIARDLAIPQGLHVNFSGRQTCQ